MDQPEKQRPQDEGETRKTFSFSFPLLRRPEDNALLQELLAEAKQKAEVSADGSGEASRTVASLEYSDGVLRFGQGDGNTIDFDLNGEPRTLQYEDPFPALTAVRNWLRRLVILVAIALPVGLGSLGVATDQSTETVFYMTLFGLFLSLMCVSSFIPQRSWVDGLVASFLTDTIRRQKAKGAADMQITGPAAPAATTAPPAAAVEKSFEIKCAKCGTTFTPLPPNAACPACSTPALPEWLVEDAPRA